jgi:hypothetical protein
MTPPYLTVAQIAAKVGFTSGRTSAAIETGMQLSFGIPPVRKYSAVTPLFAALAFYLAIFSADIIVLLRHDCNPLYDDHGSQLIVHSTAQPMSRHGQFRIPIRSA